MNDYVYLISGGKRWGPYSPANIRTFLEGKNIQGGDFCWDAAEGPVVVTVGDYLAAVANGTWPPASARRRKNAEKKLAEERAKLAKEKADFRAHREAEAAKVGNLLGVLDGPASVFFTGDGVVKDAAFYARVLGLKGRVTKDQIKAAYKTTIASCHPDRVHGLHPLLKAVLDHQAKLVNEAFTFFREKYGIG